MQDQLSKKIESVKTREDYDEMLRVCTKKELIVLMGCSESGFCAEHKAMLLWRFASYLMAAVLIFAIVLYVIK